VRVPFCALLVEAAGREDFVVLTGDLGFKALEPVRDALGKRFINAGVAEQNMVSLAAGLARSGLRPWAYSIAPFMYARPFEQIRNDVCLHNLPVVLVGNGGGYGYGVMGATHHAIEDYGVMLTLPHMRVFVPAFDGDLVPMFRALITTESPAYLRLGFSEEPKGFAMPPYAPWRRLLEKGDRGATILVVGPLVGGIVDAASRISGDERPSVWLLSELPVAELPQAFINEITDSGHLIAVEEHVEHGGLGAMMAKSLLSRGIAPRRFSHIAARGYPSGLYGSQAFHRRECGLDPASVLGVATSERAHVEGRERS
jgi:transketolase